MTTDGFSPSGGPPTARQLGAPAPNHGTSESEYVRQRLNPRRGEFLYLCNSDLRLAMERVASANGGLILDYGADLSPYRSLFPHSDYRTADVGEHSRVNYRLTQTGSVPERSETFDLILSTQVAEHLLNPPLYFAESYRLLRPGGRVFVSTHGAFEEHAFPNDYQRWTGEGLRRDLVAAGFEKITLIKLTVGPRAVLFLAERCLDSTRLPRRRLSGLMFWLARGVEHMCRPLLHWLADRWFFEYRAVSEDVPYQNLYVGIVAIGHRPHHPGSAS